MFFTVCIIETLMLIAWSLLFKLIWQHFLFPFLFFFFLYFRYENWKRKNSSPFLHFVLGDWKIFNWRIFSGNFVLKNLYRYKISYFDSRNHFSFCFFKKLILTLRENYRLIWLAKIHFGLFSWSLSTYSWVSTCWGHEYSVHLHRRTWSMTMRFHCFGFFFFLELSNLNFITYIPLFYSGPVGWGCKIHRLHLCRRVRLPQWVS